MLGDRWALLIARELLFGPKRFGQLRSGLPGVSPNVLAQRLRELEDAGLVRREHLALPADIPVYALTQRGSELRAVLIELGRWGSRESATSSHELSIDALLLALLTTFVPDRGYEAMYALHVDGERFTMEVHAGTIEISRGQPRAPTTTLIADRAALRRFAFGRVSLAAAESHGDLTVAGNRTAARRFPRLFRVPTPSEPNSAP